MSTMVSKAMQTGKPRVLITQPYSRNLSCAYSILEDRYDIEVVYRPLIEHVKVPVPIFRKYKPDIKEFSALLFTTKTSIDSFFQLSDACGIKVGDGKKYFCVTENLRNYLRKYVVVKKRRVFCGRKSVEDLFPFLSKHPKESFLLPGSAERKESLRKFLKGNRYKHKEIVVYEQVPPDLVSFEPSGYDVIVFFSPLTVDAFFKYFPSYKQGSTKIASFNEATAQRVESLGWQSSLCPPRMEVGSVVEALDVHFREQYRQNDL